MKCSALIVASLVIATVSGCDYLHEDNFGSISGDLTPELQTLSERPSDVHRNMAVSDNQDLRMLNEDLGRVWMTNGPSQLTPYPVVNTTGN